MRKIIKFAIGMLLLLLAGCSAKVLNKTIELTEFEQHIAQKMILDIRFYCEKIEIDNKCLQPVVQLHDDLAKMIGDTHIGGIALFAQNLTSNQQIITLTSQLQAATATNNGLPLFIAIDQEGGRVARLPRDMATSFAGNMAIGATYDQFGVYYAAEVGKVIGKELSILGFNLNFAPNVDVNVNPDNPVINTRSFGKSPKKVAELGIAMMNSFQQQNVIATLKHFPGHGNTHVDSHTGLPRVDYDSQTLKNIDLVPFQKAIEFGSPGMIMTAHIQYPLVDPTTLIGFDGKTVIKPATMSYRFLTEVLRDEMGFKGVIITDAMDMAGISRYFSIANATVESFYAGADIALMPYKIRTKNDINGFKRFIRIVAKKIRERGDTVRVVDESLGRINTLKNQYLLNKEKNKQKSILSIKDVGSAIHRRLEWKLAVHSLTQLKNDNHVLPLKTDKAFNLHVVVEDRDQQSVISRALNRYWVLKNKHPLNLTFTLLEEFDGRNIISQIDRADALILVYHSINTSVPDIGDVDNLAINRICGELSEHDRKKVLIKILKFSKKKNKKSILVAMQSPYDIREMIDEADSVMVAYDASIYQNRVDERKVGRTYEAVIALILGVQKSSGVLPVSLQRSQTN